MPAIAVGIDGAIVARSISMIIRDQGLGRFGLVELIPAILGLITGASTVSTPTEQVAPPPPQGMGVAGIAAIALGGILVAGLGAALILRGGAPAPARYRGRR